MRIHLTSALALSIVLQASPPAHAAPAAVLLNPVTPWNLDATPSGCALRRGFGSADRPLILEFRRFAPDPDFHIKVEGDEIKSLEDMPTVSVRYGAAAPERLSWQFGTTARGEGNASAPTLFGRSRFLPGTPGPAAPPASDSATAATEEAIRDVTFLWRGRALTLATGSLGRPFALMRRCTNDLVASWGLDPEVQGSLSRPVVPEGQREWARHIQRDYPTHLARKGYQARVNARMLVDAQGQPTDCKVMVSYNDPDFDKLACQKLLRYARFRPALDRNGKPVASFYATTIAFYLD